MTNEEFRAGWNAGKRKVLMIPEPGTSWNNDGEMDFLCNTVQTLKNVDLDFGENGVLIYIGQWLVSEEDFVEFVDDEIKERVEHYDELKRKEKEEIEQASKSLEDYIIGEFVYENRKYYVVRFTEKNTIEGFRTLFLKKHTGIRIDTEREIKELLEIAKYVSMRKMEVLEIIFLEGKFLY